MFFETLFELADEGIDFRLAVLGRSYAKVPAIFEAAQKRLETKVIHWGFVENVKAYVQFLEMADILPVTSRQDFFGASVVEAMHFGCIPLLPNALAYPEHIPQAYQKALLWENPAEFKAKLCGMLLGNVPKDANPSEWVAHYSWESQATQYDRLFQQMAMR